MRRPVTLVTTAVTGLLAAGVATAPAKAAPPEDVWFHDTVIEVVDDFCDHPETEANEGLSVGIQNDVFIRETMRLKGRDNLVHFGFKGRGTILTTNLETGGWLEQTFTVNDRDVKVVDNGDGTLSIRFVASGRATYTWSSGERFIDAGSFRADIVVDHGGTPADPEDDVFLREETRISGRADTENRDFCEDFLQLAT